MKNSIKIIIFIFFMFFFSHKCIADEIADVLRSIVRNFELQLAHTKKITKYHIVMGGFVDKYTHKSNPLTEEMEDILIDIFIDRFRNRKNFIILERSDLQAIEKEVPQENNHLCKRFLKKGAVVYHNKSCQYNDKNFKY